MEKQDKFIKEIPPMITQMASAYSEQNRASNRIWLLGATLTLFVVGNQHISEGGSVKFLGFEFSALHFFPISALLLAIVNIAYCSAHSEAYRISKAFRDIVSKYNKPEERLVSDETPLKDVAFMQVSSNYNRLYPIFEIWMPNGETAWYKIIKALVDFVFLMVPWFGIIISLRASTFSLILIFAVFISIVSAIASVALLHRATLREKHNK